MNHRGFGISNIETPQDFLKLEKGTIFDNYAIDPKKVEMFRQIVQTCKEKEYRSQSDILSRSFYYRQDCFSMWAMDYFENLKRELCVMYPMMIFLIFFI